MAENTSTNSNPNPNPNPNPNVTETVSVTITEENNKQTKGTVENKIMSEKEIQVKKYAGLLSIFTFILSLPILASVIWLLYMKDYDCENILKLPQLQLGLGIGMMFVFLISNVVVFFKNRFPIPGFFLVMVPLIVIFTVGLAFAGSYKMGSRKIMATPMWFKEKVRDQNHWTNIKSCIYNRGLCQDLAFRSVNLQPHDFSIQKLSSIESGCCKPPAMCEMEYVNATFWRRDEEKIDRVSGDCNTWNNNDTVLCYDCYSCKKGFVEIMQSKWWKLGIFLILTALLLIIAHILLFVAVMWERYNPQQS